MKPRSLSVIFLLHTLAGFAIAATTDSNLNSVIRPQADGTVDYIAAGVDLNNIVSSERFYDNGKGYYWDWTELSRKVTEKYQQTKNWDFFGELASRVPDTAKPDGFYINLNNDSDTCWYNADSNLIQYWQTYYGVFYRGDGNNGEDSTLPHGYTYGEQYLKDFAGTQSLRVDMFFYDNWNNVGGNVMMSLPWYFQGMTDDDLKNGAAEAGFFKSYFGSASPYGAIYEPGGLSMSQLKKGLIDGLGLTSNSDGSLTQSTVGQLVDFGISSSTGGHAITCYGLELDSAGNVKSVVIANSDDLVYGTERLYLKSEGGTVYLYTNEACTQRWNYAGATDWYVDLIGYISTPASLKRMYAQYTDADNPLVWTGSTQTWEAITANPDVLPTEATGWDVYVVEGNFTDHYHSWYDPARKVEFGDRGGGGTISVKGQLAAASISFTNNAHSYSLSGKSSSVTTQVLNITGAGGVVLQSVNLEATRATLSAGTLTLSNGASLTGNLFSISNGATLVLDNGSLGSDSAQFGAGCELSITGQGGSFNGTTLTLGEGSVVTIDLSNGAGLTDPVLSINGKLDLTGSVTLNLGDDLGDAVSFILMDFTHGTAPSNWKSMFTGYTGTLEMTDNVLYIRNDGGNLYWQGGDGTWESTHWISSKGSTESIDFISGANAYFTDPSQDAQNIEVRESHLVRSMVFDGRYKIWTSSSGSLEVRDSLELRQGSDVSLLLSTNLSQASVTIATNSKLTLEADTTMRHLSNEGSLVLTSGDLSICEAAKGSGSVTLSTGSLTLGGTDNSFGSLTISGKLNASGALRLTGSTGTTAHSSVGVASAPELSFSMETGHRLSLGTGSTLQSIHGGALELQGSLAVTKTSAIDSLDFGTQGSLSLNTGAVISVSGEVRGNGIITIGETPGTGTPYLSAGSVASGSRIDFRGLSSTTLSGLTSGKRLILATVTGTNDGYYTFEGSSETIVGQYQYRIRQENNRVYILSHLNMQEWNGQSEALWGDSSSWDTGKAPNATTDLSFQGAGGSHVTLGNANAQNVVIEFNRNDKPEGYHWENGTLNAAALQVRSGSLTLEESASATTRSTEVCGDGALIVLGSLDAGKTQATTVTLGGNARLTIADGSRIESIVQQDGGQKSVLALGSGSATLGSATLGSLELGEGTSLSAESLILTGSDTATKGSVTSGTLGVIASGNSMGDLSTDALIFGELSEAQTSLHIDALSARSGGDIDIVLLSTLGNPATLTSNTTNVKAGVFNLLTWTTGGANFLLSEQTESYLADNFLTGQLTASDHSLQLEIGKLSNLTWRTSSNRIGAYTLQLSGAGAYNTLYPISTVVVNKNSALDLSEADISTAFAGSLGAVVRNMTGDAGRTLSFIGAQAGQDRVTFFNDAQATSGAHTIKGTSICLQIGVEQSGIDALVQQGFMENADSTNHALTVGGVILENARLKVTNANGVSFTTGTLNGDADSVITGTIHINGAGGFFSGSADGQNGATIVLESGAKQHFSNAAGLTITGNAGTASISGNQLGALATTGADITLTSLTSTAAPDIVVLSKASKMQGGTLSTRVDVAKVMQGEGAQTALFSGASISLQGTHLSLGSASATPSMVADVDLSKTDGFIITTLHDENNASAKDVSVTISGGLLLKYFGRVTVSDHNLIIASRNTSYYTDAAASSSNGAAGLALADGLLVAINPQAESNRAAHPDLASVLDSLDAHLTKSNYAEADRTAARLAGAEAAGMGMAFANGMDRQLRAIRNRTTTMGIGYENSVPDTPYFNAWFNAEGDYQQVDQDGNATGYTLNNWGGTLGADIDFNQHLTAGLALTAMYGDYKAKSSGQAEGDLDSYYITAFARYSGPSAWVHTFVASAGRADASLKRTVPHATGSYTAEGDTMGMGFGLLYELGYTITLDEDATSCLQPLLNVSYVHTTLDAYRESGSDAALDFGDQTMDTFTLGLGARLQALAGANLYNRTSAFEARALLKITAGDRGSSVQSALAALPTTRATVKSEEQGAVGLELGAGLSVPLGADTSTLFIDASLEAYTSFTNANATVGMRFNF